MEINDDKPLIVLGAGGHAKVVLAALLQQGRMVLGLTDVDDNKSGGHLLGVKIIGNDDMVLQYVPQEVHLVNGIGSSSSSELRQSIFQRFKEKGYLFASVIHPSAVISSDVHIGEGSQVMAGAVIQPGSVLGENVIINTRAAVDHDCTVDAHVHIAPGAVLCGGVVIGRGAHIGAGSTVIQGVRIGEHAFVGAHSLVTKYIEPDKVVYGSPAKVVR